MKLYKRKNILKTLQAPEEYIQKTIGLDIGWYYGAKAGKFRSLKIKNEMIWNSDWIITRAEGFVYTSTLTPSWTWRAWLIGRHRVWK